jgi:BMFP domain-containing protein YqiC
MRDPKFFDDLSRKLADSLPSGVQALREDVEHNLRSVLESALAKLDLVTREEFEVQRAVLTRTRERLEALEKRVKALEGERTGD